MTEFTRLLNASPSKPKTDDSGTERTSITMSKLKCVTYNQTHKEDAYSELRSFVKNIINSGRFHIFIKVLIDLLSFGFI